MLFCDGRDNLSEIYSGKRPHGIFPEDAPSPGRFVIFTPLTATIRTMKKAIMLAVALCAAALTLNATPQMSDILIFDGEQMTLRSLPLDKYFSEVDPGSKSRLPWDQAVVMTACWRGYRATWEVSEGKLWLTQLVNCTMRRGDDPDSLSRIALEAVFGDRVEQGRVLVDWIDGDLYAAGGEFLFMHGPTRQVVYEYEICFTIEGGEVMFARQMPSISAEPGAHRRGDYASMLAAVDDALQANFQWPDELGSRREQRKAAKENATATPFDFMAMIKIGGSGSVESIEYYDYHGDGDIPGYYTGEVERVLKQLHWGTITVAGELLEENFSFRVIFDPRRRTLSLPDLKW